MKFVLPIKIKYQQFKLSSCTAELSMRFLLLINIKMPRTVAILILLAGKNSCSTELRMKKSFMTSEQALYVWSPEKLDKISTD